MSFFLRSRFFLAILLSFSYLSGYAQETDDPGYGNVAADLNDQVPVEQQGNKQEVLQKIQDENKLEIPNDCLAPVIKGDWIAFDSKRVQVITTLMSNPKSVQINDKTINLRNPKMVANFYRNEQYPMIWTREDVVLPRIAQLQTVIAKSRDDALNPNRYHYGILKNLQPGLAYQDIVSLEILMTDAWLSLADNLENGLLNPRKVEPTWNAPKVEADELSCRLAKGILANDVISPIEQINSGDIRYQAMKRAYLASNKEKEIDSLIINMERIRWLAKDWWKGKYVIANIPTMEVRMVQDGKDIYISRAVVGAAKTPTPRFVNTIKHVVVSPRWNVPESILKGEKLEKLKRSPGSFDSGYEVVTPEGRTVSPSAVNWSAINPSNYRLRQKSGKTNALGKIKILFPNRHAVYMHDTPSKGKFQQNNRALSHGCVRLQKPFELASLVLNTEKWSETNLKTLSDKNTERWINPAKEVPVYLVYWTTYANTEGKILKTGDLYGLDKKMLESYKSAINK